jgi:hypothetical protein
VAYGSYGVTRPIPSTIYIMAVPVSPGDGSKQAEDEATQPLRVSHSPRTTPQGRFTDEYHI